MNDYPWRVKVRLSLKNDRGSRVRAKINKYLNACGVNYCYGISAWEGPSVSARVAAEHLQNVVDLLSRLPNLGRARLTYLSVSVERAEFSTPVEASGGERGGSNS